MQYYDAYDANQSYHCRLDVEQLHIGVGTPSCLSQYPKNLLIAISTLLNDALRLGATLS